MSWVDKTIGPQLACTDYEFEISNQPDKDYRKVSDFKFKNPCLLASMTLSDTDSS